MSIKFLIFAVNFSDNYGIETRTLQYAHPPQGGVRAFDSRPRGHVCLRPHGLRRPASGPRPSGRDVRPAVPLPQGLRLQGALRAQHHGRGTSGARRRRGRGQDRQEGPARTAGADGGGPLLHGALPPCDGGPERRDALDRTLCVGTYHRADRVREEDSGRRVRLRVERLGLLRRGKVQPEIQLRPAFGPQSRRYRSQHPRAGRSERQAPFVRLRVVEEGVARTYHALAFAVERGIPRLAYGVLGHEHPLSGRAFRHPRRRHGPDVPATGCTTT